MTLRSQLMRLTFLLATLAGCAGTTASVPADKDAGHGKSGNSGATAGIDCPTESCTSGERCCAVPGRSQVFSCAEACAAPADELGCLKPSDCSGATPTCCATAVLSGTGLVTAATCKLESVGTTCTATASCPASVTAACSSSEVGPLCSDAADCAAGNSCCNLTISGATFSGCVNSGLASLGGLKCM